MDFGGLLQNPHTDVFVVSLLEDKHTAAAAALLGRL